MEKILVGFAIQLFNPQFGRIKSIMVGSIRITLHLRRLILLFIPWLRYGIGNQHRSVQPLIGCLDTLHGRRATVNRALIPADLLFTLKPDVFCDSGLLRYGSIMIALLDFIRFTGQIMATVICSLLFRQRGSKDFMNRVVIIL